MENYNPVNVYMKTEEGVSVLTLFLNIISDNKSIQQDDSTKITG